MATNLTKARCSICTGCLYECAAVSAPLSGTISRIEGNAIVIGKDSLYINNADVTGVKLFDIVEYEKDGPNLKSIKTVTTSTVAKEVKSGGGKIIQIDPSKPYLEYSYFYQGNTVSSKFYHFSESVKQKLSQFKIGDEISVSFSKIGDKKTLDDIGPKQAKKGGGSGGYRIDPIIDLIKNFSILHEAILDKAEKWAEFSYSNKLTQEQREEGWKWIQRTSIDTSSDIYTEIEKKHKYSGGSS